MTELLKIKTKRDRKKISNIINQEKLEITGCKDIVTSSADANKICI